MLGNDNLVFSAVRRGYNELSEASDSEIIDYFQAIDEDSMTGHLSNIKGIVFEEVYVDQLRSDGVDAYLFEETNHPLTDIFVYGDDVEEFQLKATDSVSYINDTLESLDDTSIVVTSEVASHFDDPRIIDSGISNQELTESVTTALFDGSDVVSDTGIDATTDSVLDGISPIPISPIGILFGLATGLFF